MKIIRADLAANVFEYALFGDTQKVLITRSVLSILLMDSSLAVLGFHKVRFGHMNGMPVYCVDPSFCIRVPATTARFPFVQTTTGRLYNGSYGMF
eukprot:IDg9604t1